MKIFLYLSGWALPLNIDFNVKHTIIIQVLCLTFVIENNFKKPSFIRKLVYLARTNYSPYRFYWFDLLTERKLKYRKGECKDCINCCMYYDENDISDGCAHICHDTKRCTIYNNRRCDEWFPVSKKELEYFVKIKPGFECKYSFKK